MWRGQGWPGAFLRPMMLSAGAGAVLLVLAGCTTTPGPASVGETGTRVSGPALTWSRVSLPGEAEPVTVTAAGSGLLVGARSVTGRVKPRLIRVASDGSSREVPLVPRSGYAFEARWSSVVSDGHRIVAVGGAPGGAHSNTRWTTWSGTNAGVTEIPQPFDTFGGWGAGDLIGPVLTTAGPVVAGSWQGARSGLDAAIWLPSGARWVRQPSAGSALESTPGLLVGPRSATSAGAGVVLAGSALHLADGTVRQSAAVWRSRRLGAGWARVDLPGSGARGEAVSAECSGAGCVVAGYVDDTLALWRLSGSAGVRLRDVPQVAADPRSLIPAPLAFGSRIIEVASAGPHMVVLAGDEQRWILSQGPVGRVAASALAGGWLYVIADPAAGPASLWRCPLENLR